jgi:hypothetical protein
MEVIPGLFLRIARKFVNIGKFLKGDGLPWTIPGNCTANHENLRKSLSAHQKKPPDGGFECTVDCQVSTDD